MRYRTFIAVFVALCLGFLTACSGSPEDLDRSSLTYEQIVNTGIANTCPQLSTTSRGYISVDKSKAYRFVELCLQPTDYYVLEEPTNKRQEPEFVAGKVLTRDTTTLDQVSGDLTFDENGVLTFTENDGIDFQAITVLLPGGEQVPFLFTIKNLIAKTDAGIDRINTSTDLRGTFDVPSYRGAVFLDPKGRGVASGYDNAVALPSQADNEELTRANVKQLDSGKGTMSLQISNLDGETGEVAGTFVSQQTSATDLGAEEPEQVKVRGIFYGRIDSDV
ncbi:MAG: photosystem II manganese-stabilizing polypeptide [Spirulinaceae cyanobacterium]